LDIRYSSNTENVRWGEIVSLFNAVGWAPRIPGEIEKAFRTSTHLRIAYFGEKIVGFGRTVDDGKYYAIIADLIVDPEFQGRGIGTRILNELRDELKEYIFTSLTAAPGKDGFYVQQGWLRQKSAFIWPRSKKQEEQHAIPSEQSASADAGRPRG
jgi:GNAT superfamily N-acetyltransferase